MLNPGTGPVEPRDDLLHPESPSLCRSLLVVWQESLQPDLIWQEAQQHLCQPTNPGLNRVETRWAGLKACGHTHTHACAHTPHSLCFRRAESFSLQSGTKKTTTTRKQTLKQPASKFEQLFFFPAILTLLARLTCLCAKICCCCCT